MIPSGFQETTVWVLQHGYPLIFVLMLIEGPVVTAAGAFAAALGVFDVYVILLLSILGNLIPDVIYYALGYWGRTQFIEKYGHYFGFSEDARKKIDEVIHGNAGKALAAIKLIPLLATPGLIMVGAARMPIKKFTLWALVITIPSSVGYLLTGYYLGAIYDRIDHYLNLGGWAVLALAAVCIIAYILQKKFSNKVTEVFSKR